MKYLNSELYLENKEKGKIQPKNPKQKPYFRKHNENHWITYLDHHRDNK